MQLMEPGTMVTNWHEASEAGRPGAAGYSVFPSLGPSFDFGELMIALKHHKYTMCHSLLGT